MLGPDGPVHPTPVSRELAEAILRPPLAPLAERGPVARRLGRTAPAVARGLRAVPPGLVAPLLVPAVGLLPEGLRAELGLAWGPAQRLVDAWLVTGLARLAAVDPGVGPLVPAGAGGARRGRRAATG